MSNRNENRVPEAAAEGRNTGVVDHTTTVGAGANNEYRCPERSKICANQGGLTLHRRRAHGILRSPKKKTKGRWTQGEINLLAAEEVRLESEPNPPSFINQALADKFPNRTVEAIKSQRKLSNSNSATYLRYQAALQRARAERQRLLGESQSRSRVLSSDRLSPDVMGDDDVWIEPSSSHSARAGTSGIQRQLGSRQLRSSTRRNIQTASSSEPGVATRAQPGGSPALSAWRTLLADAIRSSGIQRLVHIVEGSLDPQVSKPEVRVKVDAAYDVFCPPKAARPRGERTRARSDCGKGRTKSTKRALRRQNFARLQKLFKRSRKRAAETVLDNSWESLANDTPIVGLTEQEAFWKPLFEAPSCEDSRQPNCHPTKWSLIKPITPDEVKSVIYGKKGMKDGAPGPDGLKLRDLKKLRFVELAAQFNSWMLVGSPPTRLNEAVTILIPKELGTKEPAKHRPITIGSIVLRCFHSVIARRMTEELPWSPCQRAFVPGDGVAESVMLVQRLLQRARKKLKDTHLAFVDVRKAFDSVSHKSMLIAARRMGVPGPFLEYLEAYYKEATTQLRVGGVLGTLIKLGRGVRQGDPLSGLLFNSIVDWVLSSLNRDLGIPLDCGLAGAERWIKAIAAAFADDLMLCAESQVALQAQIDKLTVLFRKAGLEISAGPMGKTTTLSVVCDGKAKRWSTLDSGWLKVEGEVVPAIPVSGVQKYLGINISAYGCRVDVVKEVEQGLSNIRRAPLRPQQKLYVLINNLIPSLTHQLVLCPTSAKYLEHLDRLVRMAVRGWLRLPKDTPVESFHARTLDGGLGIPLLTKRIPILRNKRLTKMMERQSSDPVFVFLMREFQPPPSPTYQGETIPDGRSLNQALAKHLYTKVDGRGLEPASYVKAQHDWVSSATNITSGRSFISCIQLRLGVVSTPARNSRGRPEREYRCDCCRAVCGVSHILQTCPRTHASRTARHNRLNALVAHYARKKGWEVLTEQNIPGPDRSKRPDLILAKRGCPVYIVDGTVVSDSWSHMESSYRYKCSYYRDSWLMQWISDRFGPGVNVKHDAIVASWRGLFHPKSVLLLGEALGLRKSLLSLFSVAILEKGTAILVHHSRSTYRVRH